MVVGSVLFAGCGQQGGDVTSEDLLQADREFSATVNAAHNESRALIWANWFTADGRQLVPGEMVQGTQKIVALMEPVFADSSFALTWEPDHAEISASGDMGWTTGRYVRRSRDADGNPQTATGRYVSIWRREDSGRWRVVADTGIPDARP